MNVYSTARWRRLRAYVLAEHPLCRMCEAQGKLTPANEVDHINPISKGGDAWDIDNLQSLCISCHSRKTAVDTGKRETMTGCGVDGVPLDNKHHWNQ